LKSQGFEHVFKHIAGGKQNAGIGNIGGRYINYPGLWRTGQSSNFAERKLLKGKPYFQKWALF